MSGGRECQLCEGWRRLEREQPIRPAVTTIAGYRVCAHHVQLLAEIAGGKPRMFRKRPRRGTRARV